MNKKLIPSGGNALICGDNAVSSGHNAQFSDFNAVARSGVVRGDMQVYGIAKVYGHDISSNTPAIFGNAKVYGNATAHYGI